MPCFKILVTLTIVFLFAENVAYSSEEELDNVGRFLVL